MSKKHFDQNSTKRYKYLVIISIIIGLVIIITISSFFISRGHNSNLSSINTSKTKKVKGSKRVSSNSDTSSSYSSNATKNDQASASSPSETTSSVDNIDIVKKFLADGFSIGPILYNGEPVGQAMNENKAPQNTAHDNSKLGYILNDSEVRVMSMQSAYSQYYSITNTTITIGDITFNYSINNNFPIFSTTTETYSDNSTLTWQLSAASNAKEYVDAAQTQN
ncbi:hypothetical protein LB941_10680 [Ligilactobacillus sp. WILCCON 0076]|uniref:Uncharacterized protein n=1 Tax=Ligilactobacillus ubinensis TaxID=2876789 RepID=A0A9X2FLD4_9LACO|nr:hypothetical protein [Ligilactobacillus ubinensis]MCP0887794.1 hypothetical protein [Ligilactobacillus ubinensis]